jgi:hypothetical protein
VKRNETYDAQNLEAARLILENPDRYGGEDSGTVIWARLILERAETPVREPRLPGT